ncbi:MAG: M67 family metallopeptidase [Oscillospiraceae bacterium]|jgi:proteasome lid subunit RPN8/RPN11|nr:M67 family metallopeptidase [Oscillospiraceae bacterium]
MTLELLQADFDALVRRARAELPNEACGLLAGSLKDDEAKIHKLYNLTNMDHSPAHFSMDPREQLEAVKDMRQRGLQLLANWHSHPGTPARPSPEDIRLALDPKLRYLILSLETEAPVLKAFRIVGGAAEEEPLHII